MLSSKIKEYKLLKHKKTAPLFYFERQMHIYPCVYLYFCFNFEFQFIVSCAYYMHYSATLRNDTSVTLKIP